MKRLLFIAIAFFLAIYAFPQERIKMQKEGGVYRIPCTVNGLKLKFVFDTGASSVCISESVANMMLENEYLSPSDIVGTAQSIVADGRIVDHAKIKLKSLKIGSIEMNNVDAIVVFGQSAPLLLGQTCLSRLGKYSIEGDEFVFGTSKGIDYGLENTEKERQKLVNDAFDAYNNGDKITAAEKFEYIEKLGTLNLSAQIMWAECLEAAGKTTEAINKYLKYLGRYEMNGGDKLEIANAYFYLGRSYYTEKDYKNAIMYLKKSLTYEEPYRSITTAAIHLISTSYSNMGDGYNAVYEMDNFIKNYLKDMGINATDCWDKEYTDSYLGELYYYLGLFTIMNTQIDNDYYKYMILAAAWGYKEAISSCKEYNLKYSIKPSNYVY